MRSKGKKQTNIVTADISSQKSLSSKTGNDCLSLSVAIQINKEEIRPKDKKKPIENTHHDLPTDLRYRSCSPPQAMWVKQRPTENARHWLFIYGLAVFNCGCHHITN
jgi:hypothetical protein